MGVLGCCEAITKRMPGRDVVVVVPFFTLLSRDEWLESVSVGCLIAYRGLELHAGVWGTSGCVYGL